MWKELKEKGSILRSTNNPIYKHVYKIGVDRETTFKKAYGLPVQTVRNLTQRDNIDVLTINKLIDAVNNIEGLDLKLELEDFTDLTALEFGAKLGLDRDEVHKAADEWIYSRPHVDYGYFLSEKQAKDIMGTYEGVYIGYIPVVSEETEYQFMKFVLRVRYFFDAGKGNNVVRVKLNAPCLENPVSEKYYEYIGHLTVRNQRCYWHFNQDDNGVNPTRPDMLEITSSFSDGDDKKRFMKGLFQSVNQDSTTQAYNGRIFLERIVRIKDGQPVIDGEDINMDRIIDIMTTSISMDKYKTIDELKSECEMAADYIAEGGHPHVTSEQS